MVASQLLEEVFQGPKKSHHFEAIDVPLQIPWAGRPSKTAPQPVRKASVVSILRRQHGPRVGPKVRNRGLNHIERV